MRQVHKAGERQFVDSVGQTVELADSFTGEMARAQIVVTVLLTCEGRHCQRPEAGVKVGRLDAHDTVITPRHRTRQKRKRVSLL